MACNKKKLYKTQDYIDPEICSILPFRMVSGNSSLAHIVDDLSRKISLMLYSITAPNFIVGLPLLLEILSNKVWNQSYLQTNRLFTWPEHQDKNLNIWGTKRAFRMKKAFFIVWAFSCQKSSSQKWECAFNFANYFMPNRSSHYDVLKLSKNYKQ